MAGEVCNKCGKRPKKTGNHGKCVECLRAYDHARYQKHRVKWRDNDYMKRYGVPFAEKGRLFVAQGNKCACCGSDKTDGTGWHLDHDHAANKVRGVLCASCNITLGVAKEDILRLKRCAAYLMRHKHISVADLSQYRKAKAA